MIENEKKYDVALSFAEEDRDFVDQVANYLREANVNVFYDKFEKINLWGTNLIERLDQIYRKQSKYVVVFISAKYAEKNWTRFEIKSALAKAIEEKKEYILPARFDSTELDGLHPTLVYFDLKLETPLSFSEIIIRKVQGGSVSDNTESFIGGKRKGFSGTMTFPPNYIARKDLLDNIRTAIHKTLLIDEIRPIALYGMPGIGKTVMAHAAAHAVYKDEELNRTFPDGIYWATLGKNPDDVRISNAMRYWIEELGGSFPHRVTTFEQLKDSLNKLLADRACLLILDDVWQYRDANYFLVGAPHCRLLLTTRDEEVARALGATTDTLVEIPPMKSEQAVDLLREYVDDKLDKKIDIEMKKRIVDRLGWLPLAIELAGPLLRNKTQEYWHNWLETFKARNLKAKRPKGTIHDSLLKTFEISLEELDKQEESGKPEFSKARQLYVSLAIFKEDEPIPEVAIEKLWEGLADFDCNQTEDLLDDLAARSLLKIEEMDDRKRRIRLHDIIRDLIGSELDEKSQRQYAHAKLVEAYRKTCVEQGWHSTEDDGYLYDHLVYHLKEAQSYDEIKTLFRTTSWLYKRVPQRQYEYDGYLNDLMIAWELVHQDAKSQIQANDMPIAFSECVRYALIQTSVISLAATYVPALVARAVEIGFWSVQRAMSIIAKVPDHQQRVELYAALLGTGKLDKHYQKLAQEYGFNEALAVEGEYSLVKAFLTIVPYLSEKLKEQALEQAFNAALAIENASSCVDAVSDLIPHLPEDLKEQALTQGLFAAWAFFKDGDASSLFVDALSKLAPYLTDKYFDIAYNAATQITDEKYRAQAVSVLAQHWLVQLEEHELAQKLDKVLLILNRPRTELISLPTPQSQHSIGRLKEHEMTQKSDEILLLPDKTLEEFISLLAPQYNRWIKQLEKSESTKELDEVLLILDKLRKELISLVDPQSRYSIELLKESELNQRLDEIFLILDKFPTELISLFVPYLSGENLSKVLSFALEMKDEWERAQVLAPLAPKLKDEEITKTFKAALVFENESARAKTLAALVPQLSEEGLKECFDAILALKFDFDRDDILQALAPRLNGEDFTKAFDTALTIKGFDRTKTLSAFAPYLTKENLSKAFDTAVVIADEWPIASALFALASQLTGELKERVLTQALNAALSIELLTIRVFALQRFMPQLPEELQERAITILIPEALAREEELNTINLEFISPYLTGENLTKAYQVARKIEYVRHRAEALSLLIPQMTGDLQKQALNEALAAAQEIEKEESHHRTIVFSRLASQLTGELQEFALKQAYTAALATQEESDRVVNLSNFALISPGKWKDQALTLGLAIALKIANPYSRAYALSAIASQLPEEEKTKALTAGLNAALSIKGKDEESHRQICLSQLIPELTGENVTKAFEAALALKDEKDRAHILAAIAPKLTDEKLIIKGFDEAMTIADEGGRAQAVAAFAPLVTGENLVKLRKELLNLVFESRNDKLSGVLGFCSHENFFLPSVFSNEIVEAVAKHIIEICREWRWL